MAATPPSPPRATFYWQGNKVAGTNTAGVDNALAYSNGSASNWSATDGSYTAIGLTPGSLANVIFSAAGAVEQSTVLGADMAVNSVTFNNSAAVAIGGPNILTLMSAGTGASSAIVVSATANANTAISSNVALGASQTWSVASGKNLAVSGTVSGGNSLTKDDAGTLTLTGANTYTGDTTVKAGILKLDTTGSIASSPNIVVGDAGSSGARLDVTTVNGGFVVVINQTLKGIGTIDGNTTILGTHAPGNSPGLQTVNGNLIYGTGSMVNLELGANLSTDTAGIRGVHFDAVDVTGALTIGTGVTSNLIFNGVGSAVDFADAFWTSDRSWLVYDAATLSSGSIFDTITATVDSLGGTMTPGAFSWNQTGNDVYLKFTAGGPAPVPEPTGVAIGLLCVGVAASRRRRRSA
ncbi:MAG: autotransporter-associated beta strand repeat-containing protein [Chthoniobacteraceae bacterium]